MNVNNITVISSKECPKGFLIWEYLHRILDPFDYFEHPGNERSSQIVKEYKVSTNNFPLVLFKDNSFKTDPQLFEVAQHIGHLTTIFPCPGAFLPC